MCKRHRYVEAFHHGCELESAPHWHVECRRCAFEWVQLLLFDVEEVV